MVHMELYWRNLEEHAGPEYPYPAYDEDLFNSQLMGGDFCPVGLTSIGKGLMGHISLLGQRINNSILC